MNESGNKAPFQSLVKYLVGAGLGSRRACAMLVRDGRVRVDGQVAPMLTQPVPTDARVEVDGEVIRTPNRHLVNIAVNKPSGYLSTVRDEHGRPTIMNLIPVRLKIPGLVPAGRLDMDSTGLLILSNDGLLINRLTHPRYGIEKEYQVTVAGSLSDSALKKLEMGVMIPGGLVKAKSVRRLDANHYTIILTDGRNREVRHMIDAIGAKVLRLDRVRVGNLRCGSLEIGQFRVLAQRDIDLLQSKAANRKSTNTTTGQKVSRARSGKNLRRK